MDEVFIDTAGWAVLFVRTEPQHAQASAFPAMEAIGTVDQLEAEELRLLAQRLEERLAGMQR